MPIAINPASTWDYILKCDRGCDHPTVFKLATLTVSDEAAIQDRLVTVRDGETRVASGSHTLDVLRRGLRGWTDFIDAAGQEVPYRVDPSKRHRGVDPVSDESLAYLAPEWRKELAEAIIERNTMTEAERKNS